MPRRGDGGALPAWPTVAGFAAFGHPGAAWPFQWKNRYARADVRAGTLLAMPAGRTYVAALRGGAEASWLELSFGEADGEADGEEAYGEATGAEAAEVEAVGAVDAVDARSTEAGASAGAESEAVQEAVAVGAEALLLSAPRVARALAVAPSTVSLHATPVYTRRRRDGGGARAAARDFVQRLAARTAGVAYSNSGGWQSEPDLLMEAEELAPVMEQVRDAVVEYLALLHADAASLDLRFTGWANLNPPQRLPPHVSRLPPYVSRWANLNRRGDSNMLHEHLDPDWALSGVAYLSAGGDPSCALRFVPPWAAVEGSTPAAGGRGAGEEAAGEEAAEEPPLFNVSEGRIVLFPAWLQHWVPPHCGEGARLSVAFNVAATVPGRLNPDGQLHMADPADESQAALRGALDAARRRLRARRREPSPLRQLWPLRVLRAEALPPPASELTPATVPVAEGPHSTEGEGHDGPPSCLRRWRCCLGARRPQDATCVACLALVADGGGDGGGDGDGGGSRGGSSGGSGGDDGANRSTLLAPIVALSAAAFGTSLLLERRAGYELRGCLLPLEARAVNQQLEHALPRSAALSGLYFPDTGGSAAELPLLLFPDVRDAAGDLLSHLAAQRHDRDPSSTPPPGALQPVPGTILAFPAWAPCYLQLPAQLPARDVDTCDAGRSRGLFVAYSLVQV